MDEIFEESDPDGSDFIENFYYSLSQIMDPIRCELILSGGDVRLAGVAIDGRVVVRLMGPFTRTCEEKREVVSRIEGYLKERDSRVTAVFPVCPQPEDML